MALDEVVVDDVEVGADVRHERPQPHGVRQVVQGLQPGFGPPPSLPSPLGQTEDGTEICRMCGRPSAASWWPAMMSSNSWASSSLASRLCPASSEGKGRREGERRPGDAEEGVAALAGPLEVPFRGHCPAQPIMLIWLTSIARLQLHLHGGYRWPSNKTFDDQQLAFG